MKDIIKFSEAFCELLLDLGYRHCFFVPGGNSMHLLDAARLRFECHPVVHEVSAVIAAEYANASGCSEKAWSLVTAGPGLTNAITGIVGSWLESREVLIVGGQVKSSDINTSGKRQNGIQEVDGVELVRSITKSAIRVTSQTSFSELEKAINASSSGRKGPVFIEVPLDISGSPVSTSHGVRNSGKPQERYPLPREEDIIRFAEIFNRSDRPIFLLGQGVSKAQAARTAKFLLSKNVPVATSWTGADRVGFDVPNYVGRPNFFGMRFSNLIIQKSDAIFAVGARLGLQQIGFNTQEFAPNAQIVHVDIDHEELLGNIPRKAQRIASDGDAFLETLQKSSTLNEKDPTWLQHCKELQEAFPLVENSESETNFGVNPYELIELVSNLLNEDELVVSCSSGGTFTAFMQAFRNKTDQVIVSNKGLASMGYGLAGAIGLASSWSNKRVILFEGDGGFAQNLQELGTVATNRLPIKMFIFDNNGYASIRASQRAHFDGFYVGCDSTTGLGLPDWSRLCSAYGVGYTRLDTLSNQEVISQILATNQAEFIHVLVDPDFEYLPKIRSKVLPDGNMVSGALHEMHPEIEFSRKRLAEKFITHS